MGRSPSRRRRVSHPHGGSGRRPCGSEALPLDSDTRKIIAAVEPGAPSVKIDPLARSVKPKCLCVLSGSASASSGCYSRAMRRIPFAAADDRARPGAGLFHERRSAMAKGCVGDLAEVHRADLSHPHLEPAHDLDRSDRSSDPGGADH